MADIFIRSVNSLGECSPRLLWLTREILLSASELNSALDRYQIEVPAQQVALLDGYCHELWQWNERLNLTRHLDYETFVVRDVLDCVQLSSVLEPNERILDLGTGGGVPGVVLKILRPDLNVVVSDTVAKKAAAVEAIVKQLGLDVTVFRGRGETRLPDHPVDSVVARAVGPLSRILTWLEPYWPYCGRLLLTKGPKWVDERNHARHHGQLQNLNLRKLAEYSTPGHYSASVILSIWPRSENE